MTSDFVPIEKLMVEAVGRVFPAAQLHIRLHNKTVVSQAYGYLDPQTCQRPTQRDSLFDVASLTKLFVVTTFMRQVEAGRVALDQAVATVLPDLQGRRPIRPYEDPLHPGAFVEITPTGDEWVDAGRVTFRHLLTHTSGLPAWRPLYRQASATAARQMALETHFSYQPGTRIVYSDLGLILLGIALERLTGLPLDQAIYRHVTQPLGLAHTRYLPIASSGSAHDNVAPTEVCTWRKRRIVGEVHDENAARLGGVSGHAGLFSTATDVAMFGQIFLNDGEPLLQSTTVAEMTREQAHDGLLRRGLGWVLWSPDLEASGNPFSQAAYGHTGFTGTSLWIDPQRDLVVACLTNSVYYGRQPHGLPEFRVALHRAVVEAVDREEDSFNGQDPFV